MLCLPNMRHYQTATGKATSNANVTNTFVKLITHKIDLIIAIVYILTMSKTLCNRLLNVGGFEGDGAEGGTGGSYDEESFAECRQVDGVAAATFKTCDASS